MSEERRIDCERCDDVASYVLGALPDSEQAAFLAHLAACAACRGELASLETVVSSLPSAVAQMPAPPDLRQRVMSTVNREAREQEAASGARTHSAEGSARRSARRGLASSGRVSLGWRPALSGLAVAAVVALLAVIAFSGGGGGSTRVFHAQVSAPNASASVRVSGSHAALTVADMPQSPAGHIYELWIKRSGQPQPTDTLFAVSRDGAATVGVPGDIKGVKEILVTAEPLGGSKVPTSTPVIVAPLS